MNEAETRVELIGPPSPRAGAGRKSLRGVTQLPEPLSQRSRSRVREWNTPAEATVERMYRNRTGAVGAVGAVGWRSGLVIWSRRGESNPGPHHYESPSMPICRAFSLPSSCTSCLPVPSRPGVLMEDVGTGEGREAPVVGGGHGTTWKHHHGVGRRACAFAPTGADRPLSVPPLDAMQRSGRAHRGGSGHDPARAARGHAAGA